MGLPGHRRTSSHKRRRAAHFALTKAVLGVCPKCAKPIAPHRACKNCGTYNGREVLNTARAVARTLKRTKAAAPIAKPAKAGKAKAGKKAAAHDHDHSDHDHAHDHAEESPKS